MDSHLLKVVDSRLVAKSSSNIDYVFKEGASNVAYINIQSSSNSTSNTNFNLNNIGDYNCRDRRMMLNVPITVEFTVVNTSGSAINLIQSDNFGFKQYPLNRCIGTLNHQINQASYTLNTNNVLDLISRVDISPEDLNFFENCQADIIDSYQNATGSNLSPISPYTSSLQGDGVYKPRTVNYSLFSGSNSIPANSTQTVTITTSLYEPLISPFNNVSKDNQSALWAVNGEIINITWVSQLFNNMFAFYPPDGLTVTPVVSFASVANLFCIYLTPYESMIPSIPNESVVPYNNYDVFTTSVGAISAGGSKSSITSGVVSFTNFPAKIIIGIRENNSNRALTASVPDKYLRIDNITVTMDNGAPQLSACTPNQLYDISARNGLNMPRQAFLQECLNNPLNLNAGTNKLFGCGSVLVLDSMDLGVRAGVTQGSGGRFVFQITNLNVSNPTAYNYVDAQLYVIGVTNAVLKRVGSQYINHLVTAPDNVLEVASRLPPVAHSEYMRALSRNAFLSGGGVQDVLKALYGAVRKGHDYVMKNKETLGQLYETGKKLFSGSGRHAGMSQQKVQNQNLTSGIHQARNMDLFFE